MSGKSFGVTEKVIIGRYEYERLKKKAEEYDVDIKTIIEWLVEEHLDEL